VVRVAGPVVEACGLDEARLNDVALVGHERLLAEVIGLEGDVARLQVYEDTRGLRSGDPVLSTGAPLEAELGPGLLGRVLDGVGRPLDRLLAAAGPFLRRGERREPLDRERTWEFEPAVRPGDRVAEGDVLGTVRETAAIVHRILLQPGSGGGTVTDVRAGAARVQDPVAWVDGRAFTMLSRWPVRTPRPVARTLVPGTPLLTGQRVLDVLFPLARGGTAVLPGGFGTGKTVLEQALARCADVDLVVVVACGERGNELAELLDELPRARDPRTGAPLLERTVLVVNTSNMPVAAREAGVFTGITIGEYFRDQGLDVAVLADSTSRWGEALREISGRLEELPAEEGYPAYLATRLASLYERAGAVETLGSPPRRGSLSLIAAVSPPAADFSEPITQQSLRLAGALWSLDTDLARARHFPAIQWGRSHSLFDLSAWFARTVALDWGDLRRFALATLAEAEKLEQVTALLGTEALAPQERVAVESGRLLREAFLQQSAFDEVDAVSSLAKGHRLLSVLRHVHGELSKAAYAGADVERLLRLPCLADVARMRWWREDEVAARAEGLCARVDEEVRRLAVGDGGDP
jgi:V/A-type H+-transporting ATPase subunit A